MCIALLYVIGWVVIVNIDRLRGNSTTVGRVPPKNIGWGCHHFIKWKKVQQ
jgi:hypothetical protein